MPNALQDFQAMTGQRFSLSQAQQALEWDQDVMMPPKGAEQRAEQLAAIATVLHEKTIDPRYGEAIAQLENQTDADEWIRADVREARRTYERAVKLPARLVAERTIACSLAQSAWVEARPRNDFAAFLPHLDRVMTLTREMADAIGTANRYDALLDEFEPGMTEAQLRTIFADLRHRLLPLLQVIQNAPRRPDASILSGHFPEQAQRAFCRRIIEDLGFDFEAGRFDVSAHPFTSGTLRDVRLTTRYHEDFLPAALFGAIHEAGHGLYEQGLDPARFHMPAGQACSSGIHESQSRLWENLIGRSMAFWTHYFPILQQAFPDALGKVPLETFHGAVNTVAPSLIRIEADEATYNLHILVRFDLESDLMASRVKPRELPEAWNAKMREYLGIEPPEVRLGVMQDIHWSLGLIGYFPTYALGNLYGAQLLEAMRADLPDLDERIARGELRSVKQWLNQNIHVHGRHWHAHDLCTKITGKPLSAEPLMRHLQTKYAAIYGI